MNAEPLRHVRERIAGAARRSGRTPESICLVAVTKTFPYEKIYPVLSAGVMDVGENRVQEALGKYLDGAGTKKIAARFHLLGPLQSNKAKKAAQFFDLIQSLDRLELAADLQRHAEALGKTVRCLVEVKVSQESTKSGLPPERLEDFLSAMQKFSRVTVEGLMGIPPLAALGEKARPYFAQLKALHDRVKLPVLSMGMSSDFEIAIEEGATMVRVGTALFGSRSV